MNVVFLHVAFLHVVFLLAYYESRQSTMFTRTRDYNLNLKYLTRSHSLFVFLSVHFSLTAHHIRRFRYISLIMIL